jgi:uncharacterized protein (UPF0276 family)
VVNLPTLGVGLTYFSGIQPILQESHALVNVLEIEPQSIWIHTKSKNEPFRVDGESLQEIESLPFPKLLHGVAFPVGGSRPPEPSQYPPFLRMLSALNSPWVSEHLSFNHVAGPRGEYTTGFLLPPIQTDNGIESAINSIRSMASNIPVPIAVETGVNYLKPRSYELCDGEFTARVVEGADCGILLDVHNLWANEINGRQPVLEFLRQIPLDRVWEVHLAGGSEYDGYWVDSHSGEVPRPLIDLLTRIIPSLSNLRAIIFELFPSYVSNLGLEAVRSQLELLHKLWNLRSLATSYLFHHRALRKTSKNMGYAHPTLSEWENVLGCLAVGREVHGHLAKELSADPGINIIRKLLRTFRSSMIVSTLRLTSRLIMLTKGKDAFNELLEGYWKRCTPELFASDEAEGFVNYLSGLNIKIPCLNEVLAYERAVLATLVDQVPRIVTFQHDPIVMLKALIEGRVPNTGNSGHFEIEITPDTPSIPLST